MNARNFVNWNLMELTEDAGIGSYTRSQIAGAIEAAAARGSRYIRTDFSHFYHWNNLATKRSGQLYEWFLATCFRNNVIPMIELRDHPHSDNSNWEALIPADGRFRSVNKPEPEHENYVLDNWQETLHILRFVARQWGVPDRVIPVQNGNELGKGGSGDWRPYDSDPPNPEAGSAEGIVPASVISFRQKTYDIIRQFEFIAVSPALEAQSTTIMSTELTSGGGTWLAHLKLYDKIAFHCYPAVSGTLTPTKAAYEAALAYTARSAILTSNGLTQPRWVTEIGRDQSECKPTGLALPEAQARAIKAAGAEQVFAFTLCSNGNPYAVYDKSALSGTVAVYAPSIPNID